MSSQLILVLIGTLIPCSYLLTPILDQSLIAPAAIFAVSSLISAVLGSATSLCRPLTILPFLKFNPSSELLPLCQRRSILIFISAVALYLSLAISGSGLDGIVIGTLKGRLTNQFFSGNSYVFVDTLVRVSFILSIIANILIPRYRPSSSQQKPQLILLGFALISVILSDVLLFGARRLSVSLLLALLFVFLKCNPSSRVRSLLLAASAILAIFFFVFSYLRYYLLSQGGELDLLQAFASIFDASEAHSIQASQSELNIIGESLNSYILSVENSAPHFGLNSLQSPLIFIPNIIFPSRLELGDEQVKAQFPNIFGELFFDFSWFSVLVIFLLFFFLSSLYKAKCYTSFSAIYLFSFGFDSVRTTIPEFFFTVVLAFLLFLILKTALCIRTQ